MDTRTLSKKAQDTLGAYFHLRVGDHDVRARYFIHHNMVRDIGLKVLVGKGSPKEIEEEVLGRLLRSKTKPENLTDEELSYFMARERLGIDCSGLVYNVLDVECKVRTTKPLAKFLKFPLASGTYIRKLITKFRPVENTSAASFGHEDNSHEVNIAEVKPGDIIVALGNASSEHVNHIFIIDTVTHGSEGPLSFTYAQSISYLREIGGGHDDKRTHGVRRGTVKISRLDGGLLDQEWIEEDEQGKDSRVYKRLASARTLTLRRLNWF